MTIRIRDLILAVLFLAAAWAGSFGIAVIVTDWRADDSDIEESIEQLSENIDLISATTPILSQDELYDIADSVDGLVFLVANLHEGLGFSFEGETPSQTARGIERGHPIADDYGC